MLKSHSSKSFFICALLTLFVLFLSIKGVFEALEHKSADFRFKWRGERPVNSDIVVINIDEESIAKLGRWPWPRKIHGELIRKLAKTGAKVVAFDTLFTEKDDENPTSDQVLASAAQDTGISVQAFFFKSGISEINASDPLFPYESLNENSRIGFVNLDPDSDGITRRAKLFAISGEDAFPSFAVETLGVAQGKSFAELQTALPIKFRPDSHEFENSLVINFADPRYSPTGFPYPTYSYADIIDNRIDLDKYFKNKIVFVGVTAAALFDLKAIPYISIHPGVMIHANIIDNLIAKNYIKEISVESSLGYILLLGLLFAFLLTRFPTWGKLLLFIGGLVLQVVVAQVLFNKKFILIPLFTPLLLMVVSYGGVLFYRLVIEEREKRKIKGSFKQYLSPKIIDVITKDPGKLKLGGEEREVTIFFLDIAGFTTMSEALKPSQLVEVMNYCLTDFSNIILKHDGLINKYIGDCIMAFWNAPADQPRHAAQACQAALECISILPDINRRFHEKGLPSIDCRVGINTGVVVVGNMGSSERFDYTVMGDPVNLASRLEGANKQYHTRIMISEGTFEKAKDEIEARDLDLIRVKGKKDPKKVFEVICKKGEMTEDIVEGRKRYHQALALYRQGQFEDAIQVFQTVFEYLPNDHVTRVYLERARSFMTRPPHAGWDGVFEMQTK
ncbi:MAG: CHASE2 domain-containing protein [Elusimicrobiota bacterium]